MSDDSPRGVPDWFVTFADMMALLLTFFLMLLSCSELKSEEKYQALMDSFQRQFGRHDNRPRVAPGELRPRSTLLAKLTQRKQADRARVDSFADREIPATEEVATIVEFRGDQVELEESQLAALRDLAVAARQQGAHLVIRVANHSDAVPVATSRVATEATPAARNPLRR